MHANPFRPRIFIKNESQYTVHGNYDEINLI